MARWLQSGRRRDLSILLYGTDGLPAQTLKTSLESHYDERIEPRQFYGALEAMERQGFVVSRTDGLSDVYELTDTGAEHLCAHAEWLCDQLDE